MASTRIKFDDYRIETYLQDSTFAERRIFNTPGNQLAFINDPHIRMQYWGSNKADNFINVQNDLLGINRTNQYKRDNLQMNYENRKTTPQIPKSIYSTISHSITDESRATHPAYLSKTVSIDRWEIPIHNPIDKAIIPFEILQETRLKQKDEKINYR